MAQFPRYPTPVLGQAPGQSAATGLDPFRLPLPNKLISLLTWTQNNWVVPENDIFCVMRAARYCSSVNSKLAICSPNSERVSGTFFLTSRQENIFHYWRGKHFHVPQENIWWQGLYSNAVYTDDQSIYTNDLPTSLVPPIFLLSQIILILKRKCYV